MKRIFLTIALAFMVSAVCPVQGASQQVESVGILSVENMLVVKPVSGGIHISVNDAETHQFYIYSITGQMVKSVSVSENAIVDLPQGCYIVKCKQWSKKIVVR
ncbi:T9SS type A sorting domain-containing protein [Muribaculum sp.]|jgi:hypothetical protein|uniref:T9SS type A sorting domain-containing protein n=1 Tax=Muribaculum sp. TaxID=1918611 RepID=UPI00257E7815|nr:T9SS type A sorting domain-containing protein [Muribaculum sp.]